MCTYQQVYSNVYRMCMCKYRGIILTLFVFKPEYSVKTNFVNTMPADALAPYVARSSAAMGLTRKYKWVPVFWKDFWNDFNYLSNLTTNDRIFF